MASASRIIHALDIASGDPRLSMRFCVAILSEEPLLRNCAGMNYDDLLTYLNDMVSAARAINNLCDTPGGPIEEQYSHLIFLIELCNYIIAYDGQNQLKYEHDDDENNQPISGRICNNITPIVISLTAILVSSPFIASALSIIF